MSTQIDYVISPRFINTINGSNTPTNSKTSVYHCIKGFRIPSFPKHGESTNPKKGAESFKKFTHFLRSVHRPDKGLCLALVVAAKPNPNGIIAEVGFNILVRAKGDTVASALSLANDYAFNVINSLPNDISMGFGTPIPLLENEIKDLLFQNIENINIQCGEISKHEEKVDDYSEKDVELPSDFPKNSIFHPFQCGIDNPWLRLIDILGKVTTKTIIQISLEPTVLNEIRECNKNFRGYNDLLDLDNSRLSIRQNAAQATNQPQMDLVNNLSRSDYYKTLRISGSYVAFARRAKYVLQQLIAHQNQLFFMKIIIAAQGRLNPAINIALRGVLSEYDTSNDETLLGWSKPTLYSPKSSDLDIFLQNLRWLDNSSEYIHQTLIGHERLQYIATCDEASILFNLPILPYEYNSSSIETNEAPFYIPSNLLKRDLATNGELEFGDIYQKDILTSLKFSLNVSDLQKPSILVGAPGSGKSNLALYILSQLWGKFHTPFLVIDPTTGHEYRYLLADRKMENDLIVFTCGDEDTIPFRFNPLEIPPGITVRSHITRLISCFKAAYEMWDPLPAIYESALLHLYTSDEFGWQMDDRGNVNKPSPTMQDFYEAINIELEQNVLPDFGKGTEAAGILTGSSKIRVGGILNSLGHIINVKSKDPSFFQKLLERPVVIELGDVGDPNNIALVMAFLVVQLIGHFEYAYQSGNRDNHIHLLLIEEAHRLLSSEAGSSASPYQGNTKGKSAEDINNLLAEVRKYKQGIMVLDQRPSSLVGGVLDNTLINIMCRLNDKVGFDHLSNVLNLNTAQQKFSRTRLQPGDAVMLDRNSGQPVLIRSPKVLDDLRNEYTARFKDQECDILNKNLLRWNLQPASKNVEALKPDNLFSNNKTAYSEDWSTLINLLSDELRIEILRALQDSNYPPSLERQLNGWLVTQEVKKEYIRMIKSRIFEIIAIHNSITPEVIQKILD